ncbi:hypothetical protein QR680_017725 [Steinernema hermaphroditum]|uniref:Uncharacterized protein n=1 Tax=Steinernema hermaphroditum TaxID=289476 RepID=A0AA39HFL4_9BILA|nr:hypothetical protein QR680_017725 [Steinernema hermaphroditum]
MPKQEFELFDYIAPLFVAVVFAIVVFLISFTVINWLCITTKDDLTVFEKIGQPLNIRLGPHSMAQIRRGGYASTYAKEEADRQKLSYVL